MFSYTLNSQEETEPSWQRMMVEVMDSHCVVPNKTKLPKLFLVFLINLEVAVGFETSSKLIFIFIISPEHCESELLIFLELRTVTVRFL